MSQAETLRLGALALIIIIAVGVTFHLAEGRLQRQMERDQTRRMAA